MKAKIINKNERDPRKEFVIAVPDLFIIIVNWNTAQILKTCLLSIREGTRGIAYKICIVDNGSTDESIDTINAEFPEVLLIRNKTNKGFAAANNQGILASTGRYVLLLNSDTIVPTGSLEAMVDWVNEHTNVGILGPMLLNVDLSVQPSGLSFPSLLKSFVANIKPARLVLPRALVKRLLMRGWESSNACEVDYVSGACMLVRREAMEQVGLLDEDFFMYGEEIEWCYRMKKAGWMVMYHPQIKIIHNHNQSGAKKWGSNVVVAHKISERLFYRKAYGTFEAATFCAVQAIISLLRFLGSFVLSLSPLASSNQRNLRRQWAESHVLCFYALIGFYDQKYFALRDD